MTGTGVAPVPALTVTPSPLAFANVTVGLTKSISVTLTNVSSTPFDGQDDLFLRRVGRRLLVERPLRQLDSGRRQLHRCRHVHSGGCEELQRHDHASGRHLQRRMLYPLSGRAGRRDRHLRRNCASQPFFSPAGGTFTSKQSVTLTDDTVGSVNYFTVDG